MWNLTARAYSNRRGITPETSIVHDTKMKVKIHGVTSQMNIFRYLAVRDHAGRTTAETSGQLVRVCHNGQQVARMDSGDAQRNPGR